MSKHISTCRKDDAQKKIKAKIRVLERYKKKDLIPKDTYIPKNEVDFRLWRDPELGLEKIGSPNTMNKPHNQVLKQHAVELIKELTRRRQRRNRRTELVDTLRDKNKEKDLLIKDLTSQCHVLRHERNRAQQDKRRFENRVDELSRENASLVRQLKSITGLRVIDGGT